MVVWGAKGFGAVRALLYRSSDLPRNNPLLLGTMGVAVDPSAVICRKHVQDTIGDRSLGELVWSGARNLGVT